MTRISSTEGRIPFAVPAAGKPCETWYKLVGSPTSGTPLITVHGGPGAGHEYLLSLIDLHAKYGKTVIFYDQIGCGNSTRLPEKYGDESFWTVELFSRELDNLIDYFGLRDRGFDLLGQSWGGMLGGVYAAAKPKGLRKLILANAPASIPMMLQGELQLMKHLPEDVQEKLEKAHKTGNFDSDEYKAACIVFYKKHLCRLDPWPEELTMSMGHLEEDPTVYRTMYGPSELFATGPLKDWEGYSTAQNIEAETLLINGRYDEVQDLAVVPWFQRIAKVKWVQLAEASHMGNWEERARYAQVVGEFLGNEKV